MELIASHEPDARGPYGGAVGYCTFQGDLDFCITIRAAIVKDSNVHLQSGAGVVADSDPQTELDETKAKASALLPAVAPARPGRRRSRDDPGRRPLRLVHVQPRAARRGLGHETEVVKSDAEPAGALVARDPQAVILSPGPGRPEVAGCFTDLLDELPEATPVLGVCLGHQAIGIEYGGSVLRTEPVHGKASFVPDGRGIFGGARSLRGRRYHSLVVEREDLPDDLLLSAWTDEGS